MKRWFKYFLQGLVFLAPIYFSLYFVARLFAISDNLFGQLLSPLGLYFPGLGLLLGLVVVTGIGIVVSQAISKRFVRWVDNLFTRVPIVKLIYGLLKDLFASLSGERKGFSEVVKVELTMGISVVGFKTKELGEEVAVYLPQAYQVAGFIILVPKEQVTPLPISVEEAMKFLVSAGLTGNLPVGKAP